MYSMMLQLPELDTDVKDEVLENLDRLDKEDYHEVKELLEYDENTQAVKMGKGIYFCPRK